MLPSSTRFVKSGSTHGLIFLSNVGPKCTSVTRAPGAPQIERRLGRRVAAADDDRVLLERARAPRGRRARRAAAPRPARRGGSASRSSRSRRRRRAPSSSRARTSGVRDVHDEAAVASARCASRARTGARGARSAARPRGSTRARRAASASRRRSTNGSPPSDSFSAVEKNVAYVGYCVIVLTTHSRVEARARRAPRAAPRSPPRARTAPRRRSRRQIDVVASPRVAPRSR